MWQTLLLIIIQILSIALSVWLMKDKNPNYDKQTALLTILLICIIMPLYEEAIFRSVLKNYLVDVPYNNYINAIVFGLFHISNFIIWKNIGVSLFQVVCTSYLGYYVVQFEKFHHAWLVHCCYNFVIVFCSMVIWYYFLRPPVELTSLLSKLQYPLFHQQCFIRCHQKSRDDNSITYYKNTDDVFTKNKDSIYKHISESKINAELLESFEKFNSKHRQKPCLNF